MVSLKVDPRVDCGGSKVAYYFFINYSKFLGPNLSGEIIGLYDLLFGAKDFLHYSDKSVS